MSPDPPAKEKRRYPRYDVDDVSGTLALKLRAEVINISPGGMRVRTTTSLVTGRHYTFRLGDREKELEVEGSVVWCRLQSTKRNEKGEIQPLFEAGVAFRGILNEQADALLDHLRLNLVLDLGEVEGENSRIYGRFRVEGPTQVEVQGDGQFAVEKISLSGMLIRASQSLPLETRCIVDLDLGDSHFESRARVVNIRELGVDGPHTYQMGVAFLEVGLENQERLQRFIRAKLGGR